MLFPISLFVTSFYFFFIFPLNKKNIFIILISILFHLLYSLFIFSNPPIIKNIIVQQNLNETSFISTTRFHKIYYQGNFSKLKYGSVLQVNKSHCFKPKNYYNNPNSFNFVNYLLGKKIRTVCDVNDFDRIGQINSLQNSILNWRNNLLKSFNSSLSGSHVLISTLILGSKNDNYSEFFSTAGVSHLFVISGIHVTTFIIFINYLSNIFCKTYFQKQLFITIMLVLFAIISGLNIPIIRAILIYILNLWFTQYNWILIIFSSFLIFNPFLFLNFSFILSFLVSFYIITFLQSNKIYSFKKIISFNIELWFLSIPFQLIFNNSLNPLAPFLNFFLGPLFSIFIIPLTIISFLFPIKIFLFTLNYVFNIMVHIISTFSFITLHLNNFNNIEFIIFYIIFIFYKTKIYSFKIFLVLFIIFTIFSNYPYNESSISILDSKQIGSTFIQNDAHENILIDTGNKNFKRELTKYLNSKMVYTIDYLFLTHDIEQQSSNIPYLKQYFKIDNIITPQNISSSSLPQNMKYLKQDNRLTLIYHQNQNNYYFLNFKIININYKRQNIFISSTNKNIPFCTECINVITQQTFVTNNPNYYFIQKKGLLKVKL